MIVLSKNKVDYNRFRTDMYYGKCRINGKDYDYLECDNSYYILRANHSIEDYLTLLELFHKYDYYFKDISHIYEDFIEMELIK